MQPSRHAITFLAAVAVYLLASAASCRGQLANNYYDGKCGNASVETIIHDGVKARMAWDRRIVAGLLHMQFHDCFVAGCDASLLLDGPNTEKTAIQNSVLFGFDVIDDIKMDLEKECPGVVSCADIIIAATRDAVGMAGGPNYQVRLGRRDGTVSQAWMATALPSPNLEIPAAIDMFAKKGFTSFDMAVLMGAHTVGVTRCSVIRDRLYNFNGTGLQDPAMDPTYAWILSTFACPRNRTFDNIVFLDDPSSILIVDKSYYTQIVNHRGVLAIDQALADHTSTSWMVNFLSTTDSFPSVFSDALNKLAALDVKIGTDGDIRKNCRRTN